MEQIDKLKKENISLKETCNILADEKVMSDIKNSLREMENQLQLSS